MTLPTGFERDAQGRVHKDPNLEVQARITLVFETFVQRRSASKVLEFFNASGLRLPRRDRFGEVVWKRPTIAAISSMLIVTLVGVMLLYRLLRWQRSRWIERSRIGDALQWGRGASPAPAILPGVHEGKPTEGGMR